MSNSKQLWLLAGANGTGKSTFYETRLKGLGIPFINADILAREIYPEDPESYSYEAAIQAGEMRHELLEAGETFCFETVFSHPSKIDFVGKAVALGYEVILVYIHLESIDLNLARISQRVSEGGHNVPSEKVEPRLKRLVEHIKTTIPLCATTYILDNSLWDDPYRQVAVIENGNIDFKMFPTPDWANDLLS